MTVFFMVPVVEGPVAAGLQPSHEIIESLWLPLGFIAITCSFHLHAYVCFPFWSASSSLIEELEPGIPLLGIKLTDVPTYLHPKSIY